jgi:uncharacterized RDD family membrane protein YckC
MVWYYVKDGARQGPVEEAEFNRLVGQNEVRSDTLVWSEGMSDWRPYATVAAVAAPSPAPSPRPEPIVEPQVEEVRPEPRAEPEPVMAVSEAPAQAFVAAVPAASAVQPLYCSQCGQPYPSEELVRFGTATICANCKDIYAQRLRETGHVAGARVYAGFWIRFGAIVIDIITVWIVYFAIQTLAGTRIINPSEASNWSRIMTNAGLNFLLWMALTLFYEAFFLAQYGATPGKMICRLKVITPDGGGIAWSRAIGRYLGKILSFATIFVGFIMAGLDSEKRALHDYIAGTRVIHAA